MNSKIIWLYIFLCLIMLIIIILNFIYITIHNRNKAKYYSSMIYYETDWDKYTTMVKKQKKIISKKAIKIGWLKFLVKLKGIIIWK